ncbi:microcephalin [Plutella xylostella]|uniref:microcephalin n=1 Tax=Plutella xylostella TaxID=51655 RepID=UPI002032632E|nr:microcephalin [Plutella xylostella]
MALKQPSHLKLNKDKIPLFPQNSCLISSARPSTKNSSRCRLVSPLWVEGCASAGRRLPEAAFPAAARPSDLPSPATLRRLLNIADKENIPLDLLSLADSTNKTKPNKLRISSDTDHDTSTDKSTDQSTDKSMEESVESRVNTAPRRALPASTSPEPAKKSRRKLFTYKEEEEDKKGSSDDDVDKEPKSSKPKPTARLTQRARRDLARAERMAKKLANKTANSVPATTQSSLDIVPRIVLTGMTSTERRSIFDSIRKLNGRVQAKVNKKTTHIVLGSCCESEMQDRVADSDRRERDGNRFAGCGAEITGIASLTLKSPPNLTSKTQKATLKLTNGGSKPRTLNALEGAARGCRILSPDWVRASEKAGKWLHPIGYEIEHLKKISQKARIERKILQKTNSDYGYDVFCGLLVKISENAEQKEAATTLLSLCGAKIVYGSKPADVTIGREKGQVASKWVFDSVAAARIRTSRRYTVSSNDDIIDRPVIVENVDSDDVFLSLDNA